MERSRSRNAGSARPNGRKLSKKDVVPARSLYVFQFPPITGVRIIVVPLD
jgi:hypothetical protein